ncbi:MAG: FecR domain-containing protein, partial [Rhizobacter sp.]|nr:FecR domain-containing protein [Bacteriovorax sp.]
MQKIFLFVFLIGTLNAYAFDYKIEALRGEVKLEKTGDILKVNDELRKDDIVTTSDKSFVKIIYANGGKISLGPNSSIKLINAEKGQLSSLALLKGQLRATFDKKENNNYKFMIKTRTAALGIRGTDFHVIYNPDNNVSTVLTYEGKVEFAENTSGESMTEKDFEKRQKVKIPPGYISGVFYNADKASPPIKISPLQFSLLEANQDLKEGSGQKIVRPKESKSLAGVNDNDLSKKDENMVPTPKNILGDEYFEDKVRGNITIKSGGYLDLKTGIYIYPPEDSEYDAANDLYYPPVEFGGIDEESGEYVAPPGLILHPLKGFMFTTDVLQKGFHNVTSTLNSGVTPVVNGVTYVGEKTIDTLKNTGTLLRDNTGFVGTTVGKGADLVGSGVTGTLNMAEDTSSLILNKTADLLNYTVHDVFLTKIKEVKDKVPFINYLRFKFNQDFDFS